MTWNPVTLWRDYMDRRRQKQNAENAKRARQGITSTGGEGKSR
jgi:hypothetical protein